MALSAMRNVLIAAFYVALIAGAQAQVSAQLAQKAPEAGAIAAKAAQDGYVRVIVEFEGPVRTDQLRPDPQVLAPVMAEIAARGNAIIASHFGSATNPSEGQGFQRGLVRFQITPTFAADVSPSELNALAADPAIVRIYYDHLGSPTLPQSVPLIGMLPAYTAGATGAAQAVVVIDTGVQTNHEFLSGNVAASLQACFSNGDESGTTLCPNWRSTESGQGAADTSKGNCANGSANLCSHGTHVAGIAAGNNTNRASTGPVNGVAKNATLVPVQVFTRYDDPTVCGRQKPPCLMYRNSDLMAALQWVYTTVLNQLDPGVRLAAVNLSLGGLQQDGSAYTSACDLQFGPLKTDIDLLRAVGVVTVAASGNDFFVTGIRAPACISTVAAVGSTTKQDVISEFSNMSSQVGLLAPGGLGRAALFCRSGADSIFNGNIRSSVSGPAADQNNLYDCYAGTSMAAPHVAGAFATIRTVCPDATVDRILAALFNTGLPIKDNRLWGGTVTARRIGVDQARQALGCASHDFNGDGKSDLLWRDANGNLSVWLMNGARATSQAGIGSATSTWAIVGQRDFDGDGKYDLLWRDTSGNNSIWFMNGTQVKSRAGVSMLPTTWSVVGTGRETSMLPASAAFCGATPPAIT
jgi:subtilisin family serine protease